MKQVITEESGIHRQWVAEAKTMTLDRLPEFIRKLTEDYEHDYGTICHAIASAAIGTANAVNKSEQGGITGFQAGAIMWEMISQWGVFGDGPLRMLSIENMLYPQYHHKFRTITQSHWKYLQEKARSSLVANTHASPRVIEHWKTIVNGEVPFGYTVEEGDE